MSVSRSIRCAVLVAALVSSTFGTGGVVIALPCWPPPVDAPVADPFRLPSCRWCPGNRGIEYATATGDPVRAVAAGTVTFAGTIAGTTYVVVRHADGVLATYGNLAGGRLRAGDVIVGGTLIGTAAGRFHFGLRDGDRYIDPAPFLGVWRGVVRLVPVGAEPPAPAPALTLACRSPIRA
jgi:murein DD-endopeptidase MepM/ murein hydrolase activator NlpD